MAVTRLYWRDTGTAPNWDLSETQGTAATVDVTTANSDAYTLVGTWRMTVGSEVTGTSFPTSFVITARGNSDVRIRVSRANSGGTIQASSAWGAGRITTGTFAETFTLSTTWAAGDQLVIEMEGRRAPGTHGGSTATIGVNRADTYVDADKDAPPVTGSAAMSGSGDVAGTGATKSFAASAPSGSGLVAAAALVLAFAVAALSGSGDVAATGSAFEPVTPVYGEASLSGEGLLGATGDPYVPAVSVDAPGAWWRFTETAGTTAADEVGTNDLTVTGANLNVTGAEQTGSAISFDGVDDKAESGSSLGWTGAHSLTVEMWLKASSWVTPTVTPDSLFLLWIDTSGNLAFQVRDSANTTWAAASTTAPSTGAWHHVVGVWDRVAQRALLYVNGVLANQSAVQSFTDIGALSEIVLVATDGSVFTAADMDELSIYDTALPAARVLEHFVAGGGDEDGYAVEVIADSPVLWYRFSEVSGSFIGDYAGANDGTASGTYDLNVEGTGNTGSAIDFTVGKVESDAALALSGEHDLTVEAWLNLSAYPDAASTPDAVFLLWVNESGALAFQVRDAAKTTWAVASTTKPSTGGWHHVVGVWDRAAQVARLYLNGVLANSSAAQSFSNIGALSESVVVGEDEAGLVDEVALYTTALSGARVLAHYEAGAPDEEVVYGAAALSGEGLLVGSGVARAFGAGALGGSGDIAGSGVTEALGASAVNGSGDLVGSGLVRVLATVAFSGSGNLVGIGQARALGASALVGSGDLVGSGGAGSFGAASLNGSGDLVGNASAVVLGSASLSGEGEISGAGGATASGAASLDGSGNLAGDGFTYRFGQANLAGSGDVVATGASGASGTVSLAGSGSLSGAGVTRSFAAASLSGAGDLYANAEAMNLGSANLAGEGVLSVAGISNAIAVASLSGSGEVAGSAATQSFGSAAFGGEGRLAGNATDINQGGASLSSSGDMAATGIGITYGAASPSGDGNVAASGLTKGLGSVALDGSGNLVASGGTTAGGTVAFLGTGDLYGASTTGPVQSAANLGGSGSVVVTPITTAYGAIVCNAPVVTFGAEEVQFGGEPVLYGGGGELVTFNEEEVQFGGEPVTFGGSSCRYVYGVGLLDGSGAAPEGASGALSGTGDLSGAGITKPFGQASITGEGRLTGIPLGAADKCFISLETGFGIEFEDGYLLLSEVPGCSAGTAELEGSGHITGLGYLVFYGQVELDGSGNLGATGETLAIGQVAFSGDSDLVALGAAKSFGAADLAGEGSLSASGIQRFTGTAAITGEGNLYALGAAFSESTVAFVGEGNVNAAGSGEAFGQAALSGAGVIYAAAEGMSVGLAGFVGEGVLSANLVQQATRCTIALEDGFGVRLEDSGRLFAESDSCGRVRFDGQGIFVADGAAGTVMGQAAFLGEGRLSGYSSEIGVGGTGPVGEGYLNRCHGLLLEDGSYFLLEDGGLVVYDCPVRSVVTAVATAELIGEGFLGANGKAIGILAYFLKRQLITKGRFYYHDGSGFILGTLREID